MKLCTLGGFGLWWAYDVVRVGANPIYASNFRVAANLPHWVFVTSSVSFFALIGLVVVIYSTLHSIRRKRTGAMLLMAEERY